MSTDNKTNELLRGFDPISALQTTQRNKKVKLQKQVGEAQAETTALKAEKAEGQAIEESQRRTGLVTGRASRKTRKRASLISGVSSGLSDTLG